MEMEHVSLGTIFIVDQVIAFQSETLESQHPQGVGLLHVLADQGHLDAAIDGQKAFVGPILITLELQECNLEGKETRYIEQEFTLPPSMKLVIMTMT